MPKFKLTAFKLRQLYKQGGYRVALDIYGTPNKTVEAKTLHEVMAAVRTFAEELKSTERPWMISVDIVKGTGRKPTGFDKAEKELRQFVNEHLLPKNEEEDYDWSGYKYEANAA